MDEREKQQAQPNQEPSTGMTPLPDADAPTAPEIEPSTRQFSMPSEPSQAPDVPASQAGDPAPLGRKPKKKGVIVAVVMAVTLAVLAGSGALAYNFWYQNPDKVVGDALTNAIKAQSVSYKGTAELSEGDKNAKVTFDGKSEGGVNALNANVVATVDKKEYSLGGGLFVDAKGTLYFKVSGVKTAVKDLREQVPPASLSVFDKVIEKIDDQWISLKSSDTEEFSAAYAKMQKCFSESARQLRDDSSVMNEVTDAYKKHPFIKVEKSLGSKDGSLGYSLSTDEARGKEFTKALKETKFYKDLHKCDPSISIEEPVENKKADKIDTKVEVWVSRWSHEVTKVTVSATEENQKANIVFEPTFNQKIDVKAPERSITLEQLKADITELVQSLMAAPTAPAPVTPSSQQVGDESDLFS